MDVPSTPHLARSLNQQEVLEEDEYTEALSHIIARDFFPSLVHLDATNNYLDAVHSRDPHLISASVRRLEEVNSTPAHSSSRHHIPQQTPSRTPYEFGPSDTPLRTPFGEPPTKRTKLNTDLNLDDFQARYTSEDNSSFTQILDEENRQRKERWAWAWDAQARVKAQRDKMIESRERMLIEAPPVTGVREKFTIEAPTVAGLITEGPDGQSDGKHHEDNGEEASSKALGSVGTVDSPNQDGADATDTDVMAPTKDSRSAGVDSWKFKARNSLMFPPDADESPYHPTRITGETKDLKIIKYGGTRLPEYEHSSSATRGHSAPPSPTRSRIDAAITGTPYRPKSPSDKSFSLVPNLPTPNATELGPTAIKQLMTWGTLNATPRIISQTDDPNPSTPFHIPAMTSREIISHKLSNKASKSLRNKAELLGLVGRTPGITATKTPAAKKGDMAPPTWTPRRSEATGNLTPAARRLLERSTMGTAASRRAEAMERSARWESSVKGKDRDLGHVKWTPTPGAVTRR